MGRKRLVYYTVVFGALIAWFAWRALHPDLVTLRLHRGGAIEVNGSATDVDHVAAALRALDAGAARKTVTIDADDDVPAAVLVDLVDRAREAGVEHPAFETRK